MPKIRALLSLSLLVALLAGCNTVAGFGQDMKAGGQAIQKAADQNK